MTRTVASGLTTLKNFTVQLSQLTEIPPQFFQVCSILQVTSFLRPVMTFTWMLFFVQETLNIEVIDLAGNRIKTLPESVFAGLVKLRTLRLQRNQITEVGETVFRDLVNLKNLELHENLLTRIAQNALAACRQLTVLNLARNSLVFDGQVGSDGRILNRFLASQPFEALERLNLSYNAVSELDESLQFNFLNLVSLDLSHNSFTSFILEHFSFIKVRSL